MSKEKKVIPINKYSIYELKSAVDQNIVQYLEEKEFKENYTYSNLKIVVGLLTLACTLTAYFYPKPFPENYNIILVSVIGYLICSVIYWYVEKKLIQYVFYWGSHPTYCDKFRAKKHHQIKEIKMNSEIKDKSSKYQIWFDFITTENKTIPSKRNEFDCTLVFDERGYAVKENIIKQFTKIFHKELEDLS